MKHIFLACLMAVPMTANAQDGFVMGAGRWTCADVTKTADGEKAGDYFQMVGWILGYWSANTFQQEETFVDKVENAGARAIFDLTVEGCRRAPPETLLFSLTQSIIKNTENQP